MEMLLFIASGIALIVFTFGPFEIRVEDEAD
jgi:hypothetical protein